VALSAFSVPKMPRAGLLTGHGVVRRCRVSVSVLGRNSGKSGSERLFDTRGAAAAAAAADEAKRQAAAKKKPLSPPSYLGVTYVPLPMPPAAPEASSDVLLARQQDVEERQRQKEALQVGFGCPACVGAKGHSGLGGSMNTGDGGPGSLIPGSGGERRLETPGGGAIASNSSFALQPFSPPLLHPALPFRFPALAVRISFRHGVHVIWHGRRPTRPLAWAARARCRRSTFGG
jgi:hypothetical protein